MKARALAIVAALAAALAAAATSAAPVEEPPEAPPEPPPRVVAVELRTDSTSARASALAPLVAIQPGRALDLEQVRTTIRNLQASGEAGEVEIWTQPADSGVKVIVAVWATVRVEEVALAGNLGLKEAELRQALVQKAAEPLSESRVVRDVYGLQDLLRDRGFLEATVRLGVDVDRERHLATVTYRVECGNPATVAAVTFEGSIAPFDPADLTARLRSAPGSRYRRQVARADAERLETWLIGAGHRLARVGEPRADYDAALHKTELVFPIEVGPRFEVEVVGAKLEELKKKGLVPFLATERFDEALVLQSRALLRRHYQERGHYRVEIEVEEEPGDETYRLRLTIAPGPVFEIESFAFRGNEAVSDRDLDALVETEPRRLLAPGSGRLVDEVLEEDLANIRSYYALKGFSGVVVGPAEIAVEGARIRVEVPIREGSQQRVVELVIEGASEPAAAALAGSLPLEPGGPYHPRLQEESLASIRAHYEERGYQYAQVSSRLDWNPERTLVDVTFRVLEGPQTRVDRILLRGNRRTRPKVVRRAMGLSAGDVLNTARLLEVQRRLYGLGIFSRVDVRPAPSTPFSAQRDVVVRVEEARSRKLTYGLGYDSEDGVRGLFGFSHANLGGRGVAGRFDLKASRREQQVRALVRQPYLGRWRVPVTYSLFAVEERQQSFDSRRRGFQVEAERPRERYQAALLFTYKTVEVDDPDPALREIEIDRNLRQVEVASLTPRVLVDRRDDPLTPTRGWSFSLQTEYAFPLLSAETEFFKLFTQETAYLDLGRLGVVAASVRAGAIEPIASAVTDPTLPPSLPSARIPISERFFAGGRTTHRAYRRDRLGIAGDTLLRVPDPAGLAVDRLVPVGGTGLLLVNLDYRFPIAGAVGGTFFVDAGNVWSDWRAVDPADMKPGVGLGIRYLSPVGPLRLEVGWKLDREPGEDPAAIFLSFGYPF